uniref:Helix-turn-helix domain-containing protein n=1 Tax=mine drainage metagenome TaxID=410659 RepID=E6Q2D8_9ZZZZ
MERQAATAGNARDKSFLTAPIPLTLSVKEAVRYAGLSQNALYDAIAAGLLRVIHSGRIIRVPTSELERFVRDAIDSSLDLADLRGHQAPAQSHKALKK